MNYRCPAFSARFTPVAARGTRVAVTLEGRRALADAAEAFVLAGAPLGMGAARLQAVVLVLNDAGALVQLVQAGALPRVVEYDKGGRTARYNPAGRDVSRKQLRLIHGSIAGRKGDRRTFSADQCARLEILLDAGADVTLPDGSTWSVGPLHLDEATEAERVAGQGAQERKRERVSRWLERRAGAVEPSDAPGQGDVAPEPPEASTAPLRLVEAGLAEVVDLASRRKGGAPDLARLADALDRLGAACAEVSWMLREGLAADTVPF